MATQDNPEVSRLPLPPARLRRATVALGLGLTLAGALVTAYFDTVAAKGVMLGGLAGTAGFWLLVHRVEDLTRLPRERAVLKIYRSVLVRVALYGVALVLAYRLDPEGLHGLLAAAASIVVLRTLLVLLGFADVLRRLRRP